MAKKLVFPKDFLWGTATAGHQVEGNNINSDWWKWEKSHKKIDTARLKYGRITPLEKGYFDAKNPGSLITMCRVEWLQPDEIVHDCRVVHAPGASCGFLSICHGNACGGQNCPSLTSCPANGCGKQKCPALYMYSGKAEWTDSSFYVQFKSDPYIQHLFRRFRLTSAEELAAQVTQLLCR